MIRLLQFPWPHHPLSHTYYNLLIDPWFKGVQTDYFSWFSRQRHVVRPLVESIGDLNEILADVEIIMQQRFSSSGNSQQDAIAKGKNPYIDAVLISHEFTDHCNEHTLRELDVTTPIFAIKAAANVIRTWHHFTIVQDISNFAPPCRDWTDFSSSLPQWLGIARLVSSLDIGNLHSAGKLSFPGVYIPVSRTSRVLRHVSAVSLKTYLLLLSFVYEKRL